MRFLAIAALLVGGACGSSIDRHIRAERERMLALDAADVNQILAFCAARRGSDAMLAPSTWPAPVRGATSATASKTEVRFEWWNNSHFEEDDPHPNFDVVCTNAPPAAADHLIAPGLVLRDVPAAD
jgi:hypothetical protein